MAKLFRSIGLSEGEFINAYMRRRLLEKNQNVLGSITGPTGSGKTYCTLSIVCGYYDKILKKPFPVENIVFSPKEMILRLRYFEKENMKGEILVAEEWGVNNSSLDFQNKVQKMLSYVMQSFRSMNIGVIMTLPVLTMLSKSTRLLLHFHFITKGIDYEKRQGHLKPLFHQLNQSSGKSFWKYPKIRVKGRMIKLKKLVVSHPPKELVDKYEKMKSRFVGGVLESFIEQLNKEEAEQNKKLMRPLLTDKQMEMYGLIQQGNNDLQCGEILNITKGAARNRRLWIEKKGYKIEIQKTENHPLPISQRL